MEEPSRIRTYQYTYGNEVKTRKYVLKNTYKIRQDEILKQINELNLDRNNKFATNYKIYYEKYKDIPYRYFVKMFKIHKSQTNP
jgi:hypothetical protein